MRPIAYNHIFNLSNEFTNPSRASWLMRDYMEKAIKLAKETLTKDIIFKFNKTRIGFKDIEEIAESLVNKQKSGDKSREAKYCIVKDLMKHRFKDVLKCTKSAKKEVMISKENLSKTVRRGTLVRTEFMEIVDKEVKHIWTSSKEKNREKLEWNKKRYNIKSVDEEEVFKGVLVGDIELEKLETKLVQNEEMNKVIEPVIYGGIKVNKVEQEILALPPDHTIFPKVDMEEFDTDMEKCIIKSKWQKNQEQRKVEEERVLKEQGEVAVENISEIKIKGIDFRNMRPTDFKNNKRVVLPQLDDDHEEIKRNNLKEELRKVVIEYRKKHCDKFGNVIENNLTKTQLKEIKSLKSRLKNEGLACGETDKTGKLTLDTLENISKKMNKHISDDKVIDEKGVKRLENKLNRHMEFWSRILKLGERTKQFRRIKGNVVRKDNQIPVLRGTSKDHKEALDKMIGPDFRPIMGAMVGPNVGISDIGSLIVRKIAENADKGLVAKSTEEVINKFEEYNKTRCERFPGIKKNS